jgi:hypothetical protein
MPLGAIAAGSVLRSTSEAACMATSSRSANFVAGTRTLGLIGCARLVRTRIESWMTEPDG